MGKTVLLKREVAVVFICVFVLFMVLGAVGENGQVRARLGVCQANLHKWGQVFSMYAEDNDNKLPQMIAGGDLTAAEAYWTVATLPYYDKDEIRFCPMSEPDPDNDPLSYDYDDYGATYENWGPIGSDTPNILWEDFNEGSYGINAWCACPPEDVISYWGFPASNSWGYVTVEGANNVPLLLDCVFTDGFVLDTDLPPIFEDNFDSWCVNAMRLFCIDRHEGGINAVFLDFSVRKIPLKELWSLKWHRTFDTDNCWTYPEAPWPYWMNDL